MSQADPTSEQMIEFNLAQGEMLSPSGVFAWTFDEAAATELHEYLQKHWAAGRCRIGVTGGATPRIVYATGFNSYGVTLESHDAQMQKLNTLGIDFSFEGFHLQARFRRAGETSQARCECTTQPRA